MSRDPQYQHLLNRKRWSEVKAFVKEREHGLCQRCRDEGIAAGVLPYGYLRPGVDCHHIIPVESGRTLAEMEQLCYDPNNIQLLCVDCHVKTHIELRSHYKENVEANKQRKRDMFRQRNDPNYQPPDDDSKLSAGIEPIGK